ncbi:MAG: ABC transporter permease [Cyclonatronaceae bacterium]
MPLFYLLIRALEGDWAVSADLLWRQRNLMLLMNTLSLTAGVLLVTTLIAFPLAWLTSRTDLPGRRIVTLLGVLPLAIPGYVLAYALLGLGGVNGTIAQLTGFVIPRPSGYWGSLIAISLYTFPYLYLNLRAGFMGLDPSTEEAARSLGSSNSTILFRVIVPQLKPAFYAGMLIISLYVLGDFGAVSLMRFETFSYALYLQYAASYDRIYAAWIALMLLTLTCSILFVEYRLLRGLLFHRTGSGTSRKFQPVKLGNWKWMAWGFIALIAVAALVVPVWTILFWMMRGFDPAIWSGLADALQSSFIASAPAALLAAVLAVPLAYIAVRFPSKTNNALQRTAYLGYATPPLALALALIFFTLSTAPFLYQTLILLVIAYALHFLAEAMGPIRSSLYQASPRLEEAARSMGLGPVRAFMNSTFPLLRNGLLMGGAFVFLSSMKELPITFLLSPIGFETLAINVWSYSNEAMFAEAAPFALTILIFSVFFVGLLFAREWKRT